MDGTEPQGWVVAFSLVSELFERWSMTCYH